MTSYSYSSYTPSAQFSSGATRSRNYYYSSTGAPNLSNGHAMPVTETHTYYKTNDNTSEYQPMPYHYGSYNTTNLSKVPGGRASCYEPSAVQSHGSFSRQIQEMLHVQPLVIHTQILPEGVRADDPRLQFAKVVSEKTYISDQPVLPDPAFTVTMHPSLIAPTEPQNRLIRPDM